MKKVLLFPGAFNPPHNGHIDALEKALTKDSFEEVWILPSGKRDDKTISIDYKDRRALGYLFVDFLKSKIDTPIKLLTDELDDTQGRYTQEILEAIKSQPDVKVVQLIGSDGMTNLQAVSDEKLNMDDFVVVERKETDVSSTRIRTMIENNDSGYRNLVPSEIGDYIDTHGLYQTK